MSEQTPEKEIEIVAGVIEGVTQKKPDTWQVAVRPDGSQYSKNLWTKDSELVSALTAKLGQAGAFVCSASYWTNASGTQVRSLWINQEGTEGVTVEKPVGGHATGGNVAQTRATPAASAQDAMTKEEWARKDSAIHKMACIKTAADALKHTLPTSVSDPTRPVEERLETLNQFNFNVLHLALIWHRSVLAERDDPTGENVPFD